jgi:monomeric isocitrate dehydrogenase
MDPLEEMDRLLAESHLNALKSPDATAADRQAARMYLQSKGYAGPSVDGHAKADDGHPVLRLSEWTEDSLREEYGS